MLSYKTKLLCHDELDNDILMDFYVDIEQVKGFYIPYPVEVEIEGQKVRVINILIGGEFLGIAQEDHIVKELQARFCDFCITKTNPKI